MRDKFTRKYMVAIQTIIGWETSFRRQEYRAFLGDSMLTQMIIWESFQLHGLDYKASIMNEISNLVSQDFFVFYIA